MQRLNLPIWEQLEDRQNILIAGAGGGFDIFAGIPLYFALRDAGKTVHLANYSFSQIDLIENLTNPIVLEEDILIGAKGIVSTPLPYYPEGYLAQWFYEIEEEEVTVWAFRKLGVAPIADAYKKLVKHLKVDAIILIDGGVDSLMRGDEIGTGTFLEDSVSLASIDDLDIPTKILACIGMGTEIEEGVSNYLALQNMASLIKQGAFYGSCSLSNNMYETQKYEQACRYVFEQDVHVKSRINTRIIPAMNGEFGNHEMYPEDGHRTPSLFISPIMSIYWFFDANTVIENNLVINLIKRTMTFSEVLRMYPLIGNSVVKRQGKNIPY